MHNQEAINLFQRWYVEAINKLEELPDGAGGFVAFIVGLALYERLIVARLKVTNQMMDDDAKRKEICSDLGLSDQERSIFWDLCRNGLLHQGMPKIGKTGLYFRYDFTERPVFREIDGHNMVCIDPWKFTRRVLNEFLEDPILINASDSYPLASIIYEKHN